MGRQGGTDDEVILLTQQGEAPPAWFKRERRIVTFRPLRPNRFNWIADHFFLTGIVQRCGAPLFLSTDFNSYLIPPPGVRVVSMLYDVIPFLFPEVMSQQPFSIRVGWPCNFRKLRRSDALIAISGATKDDAVRVLGLDPDKISVIYPGIDHDTFSPLLAGDPLKQSRVREQYCTGERYFIYVGDTDWRKNLSRLLDACFALPDDVRLLIVGKRALRDQRLAGQIEALGLRQKVILAGFVPVEDLPPLYGAAEALVFPSLYEGFGFPVAEAMACGCPVITSNVSSLPEVAGGAALLVDPASVDEISAAMRRILEDPALRERLKNDGLTQAARFTWERNAAEVFSILHKIAG
jgi:glycosyltransferase involved in cell wall biosynthesis